MGIESQPCTTPLPSCNALVHGLSFDPLKFDNMHQKHTSFYYLAAGKVETPPTQMFGSDDPLYKIGSLLADVYFFSSFDGYFMELPI